MTDELTVGVRMIILLTGIVVWLGQYFLINRLNSGHRNHRDFSRELDRKIPFMPQFVPVYMSTYIFGLLPFIFISEKELFFLAVLAYVLITVISGAVHFLVPSKVERVEDLGLEGLREGVLDWYQQLCRPYDNFPSTHIAFSIIVVGTAFLTLDLGPAILLLLWACSIALSTLFTKQHYVLDILAGGLLGVCVLALIWGLY